MNPYITVEGWTILEPAPAYPDTISINFTYTQSDLPAADEVFTKLNIHQMNRLIEQLQCYVDVIEHGEKVPEGIQAH